MHDIKPALSLELVLFCDNCKQKESYQLDACNARKLTGLTFRFVLKYYIFYVILLVATDEAETAWDDGENKVTKHQMFLIVMYTVILALDCEQSLFYFRFSKGSAGARERWAAKPRDTSLAPLVTRVVICVSRTKKKERLLVVYFCLKPCSVLPCEQRFLSCMASSVYEVIGVAFLSSYKA